MNAINSYRDLKVWQRAVEVCVEIYKITDRFPKSEAYGLTSQIRRSAVSIASNVAEGHGRPTRDFARFLSIARGSLSELETQLEIARRIGYLSPEDFKTTTDELSILGKQLNTLLNRIRK
jgi:four helix bundle protein